MQDGTRYETFAALVSFADRGEEADQDTGGARVIRKTYKRTQDTLAALKALYEEKEDDVRRILDEFRCGRTFGKYEQS